MVPESDAAAIEVVCGTNVTVVAESLLSMVVVEGRTGPVYKPSRPAASLSVYCVTYKGCCGEDDDDDEASLFLVLLLSPAISVSISLPFSLSVGNEVSIVNDGSDDDDGAGSSSCCWVDDNDVGEGITTGGGSSGGGCGG